MPNCVRIFLKVYNAEKKNEDTIYIIYMILHWWILRGLMMENFPERKGQSNYRNPIGMSYSKP